EFLDAVCRCQNAAAYRVKTELGTTGDLDPEVLPNPVNLHFRRSGGSGKRYGFVELVQVENIVVLHPWRTGNTETEKLCPRPLQAHYDHRLRGRSVNLIASNYQFVGFGLQALLLLIPMIFQHRADIWHVIKHQVMVLFGGTQTAGIELAH